MLIIEDLNTIIDHR